MEPNGGFFLNHDLTWLFGEIPDLSLWQKLVLKINGSAFLHYQKPQGYLRSVPVYIVKCSKHGLFLDTPHGYNRIFQCSDCLSERTLRKTTKVLHK
jgi:hypothetical protein